MFDLSSLECVGRSEYFLSFICQPLFHHLTIHSRALPARFDVHTALVAQAARRHKWVEFPLQKAKLLLRQRPPPLYLGGLKVGELPVVAPGQFVVAQLPSTPASNGWQDHVLNETFKGAVEHLVEIAVA
jgi:hypothetical protein